MVSVMRLVEVTVKKTVSVLEVCVFPPLGIGATRTVVVPVMVPSVVAGALPLSQAVDPSCSVK